MLKNTQEKIDWLQRYIIVHSYLYYELNKNVISDKEYDRRAKNLAKVKDKYPDLWQTSEYHNIFGDDYNGATGFSLYRDLNEHQQAIIRSIAHKIQNMRGK